MRSSARRLTYRIARAARPVIDDLASLVLPERCRVCGVGDLDATCSAPHHVARSRLQNGRLRRRLVGPLDLPLRLLCDPCCRSIVRTRTPIADPNGADVAAFEASPALFSLVHALKYDGIVELIPWLGAHLARAASCLRQAGPLALVPIPLHESRLAERGFNQSSLLAHDVAARLGVPIWDGLLGRRRATLPVAQLPPAARRQQVHGAFAQRTSPASRELRVVLVDDVVTSGATRDAARAALERSLGSTAGFLALCRARGASSWSYEVARNYGRRSRPTRARTRVQAEPRHADR